MNEDEMKLALGDQISGAMTGRLHSMAYEVAASLVDSGWKKAPDDDDEENHEELALAIHRHINSSVDAANGIRRGERPGMDEVDIVPFIAARLDEDERIARDGNISSIEHIQRWVMDAGPESAEVYLDRFDPDRELRGVKAKRRVLEVHRPWYEIERRKNGRRTTTWACEGCGHCGGPVDDPYIEDINECPTLRAVASEWSTHPDYRSEWAP